MCLLAGQRLRLLASSARGVGLIPAWGTKIPQAVWCDPKFFLNFLNLLYLFFKSFSIYSLLLVAPGLCGCKRTFSGCGERGLLSIAVRGLLIVVASLVVARELWVHGLQELRLSGSRALAQWSWHCRLVAPWPVGSSWTRD